MFNGAFGDRRKAITELEEFADNGMLRVQDSGEGVGKPPGVGGRNADADRHVGDLNRHPADLDARDFGLSDRL